jgi:hypothetical protein
MLAGYLEGRQRRTTGKAPVATMQIESGMGQGSTL